MSQNIDYTSLLAEYKQRKESEPDYGAGSLVVFTGIEEGKDVYNPSGPFSWGGEIYQWARVESREAQDAVAMLFKKNGNEHVYDVVKEITPLPVEDPFVKILDDQLLIGGVEISKNEKGRVIGYKTVFYKATSFDSLTLFAEGPDSMKDIRIAKLPNSFLVFTRPYIPVLGRMVGRIATTQLASLEELQNKENLTVEATELLPGLFADLEWGGVNDTYVFANGLVGVLCHIAKFDELGKRHYAPAAFVIDPATKKCSPLEMIAERADFPNGPIKIMPENLNNPEMQDDLADVVFSSRLTAPDHTTNLLECETLELTCGLSDAAVGVRVISNPFPRLIQKYF